MSKKRKAIVAVGGVLGLIGASMEDGIVSGGELVNIGIGIVTAIGVYLARNT